MTTCDETTGPARRRAAFGFIFATALMNAVSFGIVLPVLPNLIKAFAGGDTASATEWSTLISVVWGVMQLICGPALGVLSDRIGRRPVLLISLFGLAVDFFIMALAPTMVWLIVGRVLNGMTAASFSTANAYVADVTPPEQRARAFGWIGSALSLGFLGGPVLGGLLAGIDLRLPFYVAGGLTALNWVYGFAVLPESLAPAQRATHFDLRKANPFGALLFLKERANLLALSLLSLVFSLAWMVGPAIFVLYGGYRYGWTPVTIGLVMMVSGALASVVQMALVGPVVARVGERGAMLIGATAGAIGYACFGLATTGTGYLIAIPVYALMNLFMPALQGLATRRLSPAEQGQLQGVVQGMQGLASVFGPLLFGLSFAWSIRPGAAWHVPGLAFFIASTLMVVALLSALRNAKADAEVVA
ncbi:tetracycline resistance MFS efflux pump [Paraburkholderia acidicola]|uniref:Tetracycline resistance MFS efflux pump n=1 Tax=Paraburkholderia acidicola TaxID=1912599 RepID=A0A2A4ELD6_9BURK|nr:MFS transporter [Paraburkholderia acidicola]PCE22263.1 tetracycline resistance MFS efflux pump [Paraburkholderia acidicola]